MENNHQKTNQLANETSPYLQQHANNPVNWHPWGQEALEKARTENKPLIVSIGYAACHWCHVMEDESFEDMEVAEIMNEHFVPIKVDREERPDIDELYIDAVSLMTGRAGWPLNVFTLPDGKPFYGGTYFPKEQWIQVCNEISRVYEEEHEKVMEYAGKLEKGIQQINIIEPSSTSEQISQNTIQKAFDTMASHFDPDYGGRQTAPKFPLPDNYLFLLRYQALTANQQALDHINLSLTRMARGGIYDQIGGGFHRYSTDEKWKVPHFEKMLYDNGQMLTLYSEAYQATGDPLYKTTTESIFQFLKSEMTSPEGGFYSSIDADSEGEEGRFYTWTEAEIEAALDEEDWPLVKSHFGINEEGLWENGRNVLLIAKTPEALANEFNMPQNEVEAKLNEAYQQLKQARDYRQRPDLDDKCLASWNALTLKGLTDAYKVLGNEEFHEAAKSNLKFIHDHLMINGNLYRSYKNGIAKTTAFLEDYATLIQALIGYYENTFEEDILWEARNLTQKVMDDFLDTDSGMFYSTNKQEEALITRKIDFSDNVIGSPNAIMAHNLFYLSHYFNEEEWSQMAIKMLQNIQDNMTKQPEFFSKWAALGTLMAGNFYEVAIAGPEALAKRWDLEQAYCPNKVIAGTVASGSKLPLLKTRTTDKNTLIHVCTNQTCQAPTSSVDQALAELKF